MGTEILPDPKALRSGRRGRVLAQMAADDVDILVLGRQANVRYVTGAPQLWVAGTRPFGPICEVIGATGEIHLNSTWDEGIPEEIGHDHLYGLAWNPMTLIDVLKKLPGAATVRRVGTDSLTPTFAQLLPMAFPNAELVDAEPALRAARRIKTADEIAVLRGALGVAEHALAAARSELAPGVTERSLTGAMMEAMAAGGITTAATQDGAWITPKDHSWRRDSIDARVADGDLVRCPRARWQTVTSARSVAPRLSVMSPEPKRCSRVRMRCGSISLPRAGRAAVPPTYCPHTTPQGSRCPRRPSRTVSVSGSTRR